jgi:hypothetical protein
MPKLKYIKVKPEDFDVLIVAAARYAIGRSYIVSWVADIIRQNRKLLHKSSIEAIIRSIVNAPSLGHDIDRENWIDVKNKLEDIRRQYNDRYRKRIRASR